MSLPPVQLVEAVARAVPTGLVAVARDMRVVWANEPGARQLDTTVDALVGARLFDLAPQLRARQPFYDRVFAGEPLDFADVELPYPDGPRYFDVHYRPLRDADGAVAALLAAVRETTPRKRAELSRQRSAEERSQALLAAIPDLIFRLSPHRRFLDYHAGGNTEALYRRPGEFLGKHIRDVLPAEVARACEHNIDQAQHTNRIVTWRYELPMPNGTRHFEARVVPGPRDETTVLVRDISEAHRHDMLRNSFVEQVMAAQDDERRRISRELHDGLGSALTSLAIGLEALGDPPDPHRVDDLKRQVHDTLRDVQWMARGLHPMALETLGLAAALEQYVESYHQRHGTSVDLHTSALPAALAPASAVALYRIVQEALTNVAKHAAATRVSVVFTAEGDELRLVVEDDGRGLPNDFATHGLGIHSIRERAALLGGSADLESTPGGGTTLFVRIPHRPESHD